MTLNNIIDDIINLYYADKPADTSPLNRTQVAKWVHSYRALLIKQDLDKGRNPNEGYMQTIPAIRLIPVDFGDDAKLRTGLYRYMGDIIIPKIIDLHYKLPLMVYTLTGEEIHYMPESRAHWHKYRKYVSKQPIAYMTNDRLYVEGCSLLEYIKIKSVFEDPTELANVVNPLTDTVCYDPNEEYPLQENLIPTVKQMIFQSELKIMSGMAYDNTNNSRDDAQQSPVSGNTQQSN
jgi:hypothetical protein